MIPYILTALGGYLIGSSVKQYASGGLVYQFDYNCVYPSCGDELEFIIANMKPISANEFLRNVSLEEVNNSLMFGIKYESKARLKSDYGVSFYKLKKDGIDAYILVNSAIEYVFKKTSYASGGKVQLLAPNGKPSNLTPEQYKLVRTPEFKAWFGDWENDPDNASKVIDENGEPMVVYHGTKDEFSIYDIDKAGTKTDTGMWGKGFYFSSNKKYAETYANKAFDYETKKVLSPMGYVLNVFLSLKNPYLIKNQSDIPKIITPNEKIEDLANAGKIYSEKFRETLVNKGYDGVIIKFNFKFRGSDDYELVSFYPNQIKLADTNTTFDASNPDIRYARGGLMPNDTFIGKRIKLIAMNEEPYPVEPNTLGTIQSIDGIGQIHVKWDNGRSLAVVPEIDEYEIIE